jgi:hypothetical protein
MTGSPKTISVAAADLDTPTLWAAKVRTALAADSAVAAMFAVSGATTAIILTRKPTTSFTVAAGTLNIYAANDGTLNINISAGPSGITTAASSANTTAGVASDGVKIYDGDGNDIEGEDLNMAEVCGLQIAVNGYVTMDGSGTDMFRLGGAGEIITRASTGVLVIDGGYTITAGSATSLTITVFGA